MIDPQRCTKFDRTDAELEEFAIFCICVAGKNAKATARAVDRMLTAINNISPELEKLTPLRKLGAYTEIWIGSINGLAKLMKASGIGNFTSRAKACYALAKEIQTEYDNHYLRTCSVQDLEKIKGIGAKTARYFMLHTRPNQRLAALDVHVLTYLRESGIIAPKTTPSKGSKQYAKLEEEFLRLADMQGKSASELDLQVWNKYSKNGLNYDKQRKAKS
jgi:endonuclease III